MDDSTLYTFGVIEYEDDRIPIATIENVIVDETAVHGYVTRTFPTPAFPGDRLAVWPTGQHDPVISVEPRHDIPPVGSFIALVRPQEQQP